MRVLAVDPGFGRIGFAILARETGKQESLIFSECFETSAAMPFHERLALVGQETEHLIEAHAPDALAIETLFFNTNQKTAIQVAEARGVILYAASKAGLAIYEYTPLQVKIATTGYGRSTKAQITAMIPRLIPIETKIRHDDEYDAIAIGLTCLASVRKT